MIYRLLILFGLVLAAVAVWLTLGPVHLGPVTTQAGHSSATDQGYSATDASVVETGLDGLPMYTLHARQVQQGPDSNIINLTTVHMTFRDESGGQWQARSDTAVAHQDSAQIDLSGAVHIDGTFAGSDQPLHLLTDTLHVDTHTEIIRTHAPVTLTWTGGIVLTARGLTANITEQVVKLDAQVHGEYVP